MFVITADQVSSRTSADAVDDALASIARVAGDRLVRAPERTVGDEVQAATMDPRCALDVVLELTRRGTWSVGCGTGEVEGRLPRSIRAARGTAFVRAREAVDAAKRRPTRFALRGDDARAAAEAQAVADLLLALRSRRSEQGWEVFDLLGSGLTRKAVADRLQISEQAVSLRVRAAQLALEDDALPALAGCLQRAAEAPA